MRDPKPDNISGEKIQRHVFKHEINWGYVALAVAVVYVGMKVLDGDGSDVGSDAESDEHLIA